MELAAVQDLWFLVALGAVTLVAALLAVATMACSQALRRRRDRRRHTAREDPGGTL